MCSVKQPKVEPAPAPPPPSLETASQIKEATPRSGSTLKSKRRGRSSLVINRTASSGLNSTGRAGLSL